MPIQIQAAVMTELHAPLSIETLELDDPRPNEVLIEVKAAGICHTDLQCIDGGVIRSLPTILGHEAAGIVSAVGSDVTSLAVGDHVIPLFCPECGICENCTSGRTTVCKMFGVTDGAARVHRANGQIVQRTSLGTFSTYALAPEYAVVKIRKDARFDRVFYCGCGVTTGVGAVMFDARVARGDKVAVFGAGGIGLNAIQGARLAGASMIIAIDTNPARERDARFFGATNFINAAALKGELVSTIHALTGGGVDHSFECIGNVRVMRQAVESTNPAWGRCTIVDMAGHDHVLELNPNNMITGRAIKGTLFGGAKGRSDVPKVIDWYMNNDINIDDLVTHSLPLTAINEGLDLLRCGNSIRTVIKF